MEPRVLLLHVNQSTTGLRRSALFPCCRCPLPLDTLNQQPCAGAYFKSWSISIPRARCLASISGLSATARVSIQPFVGSAQPGGSLCLDRCALKTAEKPVWNETTCTWEAQFEPVLASRGAYHVAVYVDGVLVCTSKPMCVIASAPKTLIAMNAPITTPFERVATSLRQKYIHYRTATDARGNAWPAVTFQTADAARIAYYTQLVYSVSSRVGAIRWVPCIGLTDSITVAQVPPASPSSGLPALSCLPPPPPLPLAFTATYYAASQKSCSKTRHAAVMQKKTHAEATARTRTVTSTRASQMTPPPVAVLPQPAPATAVSPLQCDDAPARFVRAKRVKLSKPSILSPVPAVTIQCGAQIIATTTPGSEMLMRSSTAVHAPASTGLKSARGIKRSWHPWHAHRIAVDSIDTGGAIQQAPDIDIFKTLFEDAEGSKLPLNGDGAKLQKQQHVQDTAPVQLCAVQSCASSSLTWQQQCARACMKADNGVFPLPPNADLIDMDAFFAMFGLGA